VNGPITTELPASFLQLHHEVEIMLDVPAGERLGGALGLERHGDQI
jgi:6-phosphogluconolactonase/glucosamine-6-phosphate isomerase/deaminase